MITIHLNQKELAEVDKAFHGASSFPEDQTEMFKQAMWPFITFYLPSVTNIVMKDGADKSSVTHPDLVALLSREMTIANNTQGKQIAIAGASGKLSRWIKNKFSSNTKYIDKQLFDYETEPAWIHIQKFILEEKPTSVTIDCPTLLKIVHAVRIGKKYSVLVTAY